MNFLQRDALNTNLIHLSRFLTSRVQFLFFIVFLSIFGECGGKEPRTLLIGKNSKNVLGKFRTKIGEANFVPGVEDTKSENLQ